jgi:UDP-N-acetylmuramoylalanine-D-glutamate ligase
MQEKIGFIGLGAMGAPMVQRLLDAGHRVVVHDLDAGAVGNSTAAGAQAAGSPMQVAAEAEIVMVSAGLRSGRTGWRRAGGRRFTSTCRRPGPGWPRKWPPA